MQGRQYDPRSRHSATAASIRSRALWPGIAAVLLCYFGFGGSWVVFSASGWILVYTLQGGGIAMVICTLLLLTGWKTAVAIEGIASMLIGGGLLVSGLLMIPGNITQGLLNLVFGYMFASSGWSGYAEWRWLAGSRAPNVGEDPGYDPGFQSRYEQTLSQPPADSLASQLLDRSRNPQPQEDPEPSPNEQPPPDDTFDVSDAAEQTDRATTFEIEDADDQRRPPEPQDTPDGFLASFADPTPDKDQPT